MSDTKYCYPNTNVLINKLNIQDYDVLHDAERAITTVRSAEIASKPPPANFDFETLKKIHKNLFKDIYPWAGKIREVNIAKSNLFCLSQFIEPMAKEIFDSLKSENYLKGLNKEQFINRLAHYMGEINALHPFREGNGRTQRIYHTHLAKAAGYDIAFEKMNKESLLNADIDAMSGRYELLEKLLSDNVQPIQRHSIKTQLAECKAQAAGAPKIATTKKITQNRDGR